MEVAEKYIEDKSEKLRPIWIEPDYKSNKPVLEIKITDTDQTAIIPILMKLYNYK